MDLQQSDERRSGYGWSLVHHTGYAANNGHGSDLVLHAHSLASAEHRAPMHVDCLDDAEAVPPLGDAEHSILFVDAQA